MAALSVVYILTYYIVTSNAESNALNNLLCSGDYDFIDLTHNFDEQTIYWPNSQSFYFTKRIEEIRKNGTCGDYDFIDLTHSFDNDTIYWTDSQQFKFTKKIEEYNQDGWYASNDFTAGEHGGTHIDAPYHFNMTGMRVGQIPLEKLIVTLIIVDVSSLVNDDPNFVLYKHHLDHLLYEDIGKRSLVVFKFGWSKYFNDRNKYLGTNEDGTLNFPGLSAEIAEWITTSYKNVVGIGVDVASVDPGSSKTYDVHKTTARAGLYNVENVKLTQHVPNQQCTALVMPMKIAQGTGAPLRLVAICPKENPSKF